MVPIHQLRVVTQHHRHRLSDLLRRIDVVATAEIDDVECT
jgi:hypothetical protein